jgi:hypothetical protein
MVFLWIIYLVELIHLIVQPPINVVLHLNEIVYWQILGPTMDLNCLN